MAKIGPGMPGGNDRQTLTDENAEGLLMSVDKTIAMFAWGAGTYPEALPVMVDSRLDTQSIGSPQNRKLGRRHPDRS